MSRAIWSFGTAIASRGCQYAPKLLNRTTSKAATDISKDVTKRSIKDAVKDTPKKASRNRLAPDPKATGPHTVFKRDPLTSKVSKYETYQPQTNLQNPNRWESIKRYDGPGGVDDRHYNKIMKEYFDTPHVHDPYTPGGVRKPEQWEIPI